MPAVRRGRFCFPALDAALKGRHIMQSLISEPLGLYGWKDRDAILLAALLSEEPLLLIGSHGCAKSFILERLAQSLGLEYRFYNASLVNYDDLVGIPMPNATRTGLSYIATDNCIWDAQVVFFDEINRTRPDLQNKLFPIIHEKRVQGRDLSRLVFRWAAMNPPPDEDEADDAAAYFGAEPLDAALADRFPFIMEVPDWDALAESEQKRILADQFAGRHEFPVDIGTLITEAKERCGRLVETEAEKLSPFVIALVAKLHGARYDISTRRACMLLRTILAVHAARMTLAAHAEHEDEIRLYDSAVLTVQNALPDRTRRKIKLAEITALCKAAWDLAALSADDPIRDIFLITDPVVRLEKAVPRRHELSSQQLATVIGEGIAAAVPPVRRALALATYLAVRDCADIPATTMEILTGEIIPALMPSAHSEKVSMAKASIPRAIATLVSTAEMKGTEKSDFVTYLSNLLYSQLPDGYASAGNVRETADTFTRLWKEFALS